MKLLRRKVDEFLIDWKNNSDKKPLIIKGARQIGKTESIKNFAKNNFLSSYNSKALLKRVNLVAQFLEDISSNVNLELLLDKFVIDLGDVDE